MKIGLPITGSSSTMGGLVWRPASFTERDSLGVSAVIWQRFVSPTPTAHKARPPAK
jgi:hypothetical protein